MPSAKTFFIRTPADLLEKLKFEAETLWSSKSPADIRLRAYLVLNCASTAWHMKDWVYNTLQSEGRLDALHSLAGRHIKSREDFGAYLIECVPQMAMVQQIATSTKHLALHRDDPNIGTGVRQIPKPSREGYDAELEIFDAESIMSAADVMIWLYWMWEGLLNRLGLLPAAVCSTSPPQVSNA